MDDLWDNGANWNSSAPPTTYPDSINDDALIEGSQTVDLTTETIDDLTIQHNDAGTVTFDEGDTDAVLTVDTISIFSTGDPNDIYTIELRNGVSITNN